MKNIKVYEDTKLFDEIMEHCQVDMDISSWDYSSDIHSGYNYNAQPLTRKYTDYPVGWLVYREWEDDEGEICNETYITIEEYEFTDIERLH